MTRSQDFFDELIDEKGWKEFVSDQLINKGLPLLDKLVFEKYIPVTYHKPINDILLLLLDEDYQGAVLALAGVIQEIVNINWFSKENQKAFIDGLLMAIGAVVKQLVENAKEDETA